MRAYIITFSSIAFALLIFLGSFSNLLSGWQIDVPSPYNYPPRVVGTLLGDAPGLLFALAGLGYALYNRGRVEDLDFSAIISIGNQADLELSDYADMLLDDAETRVLMALCDGTPPTQTAQLLGDIGRAQPVERLRQVRWIALQEVEQLRGRGRW